MKQQPTGKQWGALVAAVRQCTAVSSAELARLVQQHTAVSANYAMRRLQREGVLAKADARRKLLYLVVTGSREAFVKEPLVAVKAVCGEDVLFGYGTALFLHGLSRYGRLSEIYVLSDRAARRKDVGGVAVRQVKSPLREEMGITSHRYGNQTVRVTDLERSLVDCIHRPKYAQGWENVVHALVRAEGVNPRKLVDYVKLYRTPSLVAKVGLILERYQQKWKVSAADLGSLRSYLPPMPVEFVRGQIGTLNKDWNLYVPEGLLNE